METDKSLPSPKLFKEVFSMTGTALPLEFQQTQFGV